MSAYTVGDFVEFDHRDPWWDDANIVGAGEIIAIDPKDRSLDIQVRILRVDLATEDFNEFEIGDIKWINTASIKTTTTILPDLTRYLEVS